MFERSLSPSWKVRCFCTGALIFYFLNGIACTLRLPFRPSLAPEYAQFSASVHHAYAEGALEVLKRVIEDWATTHPPLDEEGELYASLLTQFTPPLRPEALFIAEVFRQRFPQHPQRWRADAQDLLHALEERQVTTAFKFWQSLSAYTDIDAEMRASLARRVASLLINQGMVSEGILLALRYPPPQPSPLFWQYLLRVMEQCCDPNTFPTSPLTPYLKLRTTLRRGLPLDLPTLRKQWMEEIERLRFEPAWGAELALYPEQLPYQRTWAYLLSREPAHYPLAIRELKLLLCSAEEGSEWWIVEGKDTPISWVNALVDLPQGSRVLGFLREDHVRILAPFLLKRGSYLLVMNPLQVPTSLGNVLSLGISARDQAEELTRTLSMRRVRAVALLLPDSDYGEELLEEFSSRWFASGGWFTAVLFYPPNEVDFTSILDDLSGRNVTEPREVWKETPPPAQIDFDALVIAGPSRTLARIPSQLLYHDIAGIPVVGDLSWQHPQLFEAGSALEGVSFLSLLPEDSAPFLERFRSCIPPPANPPLPLDGVTWEGLKLLEAEVSGSVLPNLRFLGITGERFFSSNGRLVRRFTLSSFARKSIKTIAPHEPLPLFHPESLSPITEPSSTFHSFPP